MRRINSVLLERIHEWADWRRARSDDPALGYGASPIVAVMDLHLTEKTGTLTARGIVKRSFRPKLPKYWPNKRALETDEQIKEMGGQGYYALYARFVLECEPRRCAALALVSQGEWPAVYAAAIREIADRLKVRAWEYSRTG